MDKINNLKYRSEIDGIRAFAVLSVVFFHAAFQGFSGGYVGVDIFFVISGYVISLKILSNQISNFDYLNFLVGRIKRIVPAAFLVIIMVAILSIIFQSPYHSRDTYQSIAASSVFLSNELFATEYSNYFSPDSAYKPLLHTWSLAVEVQFYIFFPVLILIAKYYSIRFAVFIGLGILLVSLSLSILFFDNSMGSDNFYHTIYRVWEFGAGVILAFIKDKFDDILSNKILNKFIFNWISSFMAVTGLLMMCAAVNRFDETTNSPSIYSLVPVLGTCFLILGLNPGTLLWKLFTNRFIDFIGVLSFGIYMFHWPVFTFYKIILLGKTSTIEYIILIFFIILLSYLSYKYFEKPIRSSRSLRYHKLFIIFSAFSILLLFIGYSGHKTMGFQGLKKGIFIGKNSPSLVDTFNETIAQQKYLAESLSRGIEGANSIENISIVVIGDSMADDFYMSLSSIKISGINNSIERIRVNSSCLHELRFLIENPREKLINSSNHCNTIYEPLIRQKILHASILAMAYDWNNLSIINGLNFLQLPEFIGKKLYIVESFSFFHIAQLSYSYNLNKSSIPFSSYAYQNLLPYISQREVIDDFNHKNNNKVEFIPKRIVFCSDNSLSCSLFDDLGFPLFIDSIHLSTHGIKMYGIYLKSKFNL